MLLRRLEGGHRARRVLKRGAIRWRPRRRLEVKVDERLRTWRRRHRLAGMLVLLRVDEPCKGRVGRADSAVRTTAPTVGRSGAVSRGVAAEEEQPEGVGWLLYVADEHLLPAAKL